MNISTHMIVVKYYFTVDKVTKHLSHTRTGSEYPFSNNG